MKKYALYIPLLVSLVFTKLCAQDLFSTGMKPGKYAVGFRAVEIEDYGRMAIEDQQDRQKRTGRAITIHVWYPSKNISGNAMQYGEYVALLQGSAQRNLAIERAAFFRSLGELSGDTLLFSSVYPALAASRTNAYRNAALADGIFPLIIYPDNVHVQSILCEYLASKGYIIVSPVIKGAYSSTMEYSLRGIETGVTDMQFVLGYMRRHYKVKDDFALMGTGFNATLALGMQMRDNNAKAMVSLEGGITTGFEESLIQQTPFYDLLRCNRSMLIIHSPHPDVHPEITYRYKYAEKIYQYYPQSSEFYFLNYGVWERSCRNIFPKANKGNTWQSFAYAAQSVAHYLNWQLKDDINGKTEIFNSKWPKGFVQTSIRAANALPPAKDELVKMLKFQGVEAIMNLYNERRKSDPQPFTFDAFFEIGQQLMQQTQYHLVFDWAKCYADSYPFSAVPYSMLGRALLELGNKKEAKEQYEKALVLLPGDTALNEAEKSFYKTAIDNRLKGLDG